MLVAGGEEASPGEPLTASAATVGATTGCGDAFCCAPTPAELKSLLEFVAPRDRQLELFLTLAAVTGARRAQLLGLRWHNVSLAARGISFCAGWVEGPDGPVLAPTKTKRRHVVDLDAGLAPFRLHDLRHFNATEMLNAGVPVVVVSRRLDHKRVSTTLDRYAHAVPGQDEQASATASAERRSR